MTDSVTNSSGKILAGFLAPHPPHLVYAENPEAQRAAFNRGLGNAALGLRKCPR